jgi:hypothetical protein
MTALKEGAIVNIRKSHDELVAENKTYYRGQFILAETSFGSGLGLKVGTKDVETGLGGIPYIQLSWLIDPNISYGGNRPFVVRNTDLSYSYNPTNDTVTVTDGKLVGVQDPIVYLTQTNTALTDDEFTFNTANGTITISALSGGLQNNQKIIIFTGDGVIPGSTSIDQRVSILEKLTAPLLTANARIFWRGTANTIPGGWVEDTDMRGIFPMGYIPNDPDYDLGKSGGTNQVVLQEKNLPSIQVSFKIESTIAEATGYGLGNGAGFRDRVLVQGSPNNTSPTYESDPIGDSQPLNIVNKYLTGIWIKYTG